MNTTTTPAPVPPEEQSPYWAGAGYWDRRHAAKLREIATGPSEYDCVFIGDSITHNWEGWSEPADVAAVTAAYGSGELKFPNGPGRAVWDELRRRFTLLNLGIGGDKTQNVLWRIEHGELDGYRARLVSLMIGTNNAEDSPEDRADGIRAVVAAIAGKQPSATILLTPIFPSGPTMDDPGRISRDRTNRLIRDLANGDGIVWLDFNDRLLGPDGSLSPSMMPDLLHPLEQGYRIWADALLPYLSAKH